MLEEEEKELGVVLLDIGGGTSDMVIYKNGAIVHTSVLPIGGSQVTNDIAIGLRTTKLEALRIKHEFGTAITSKVNREDIINLKGIAGREDRVIEKRLLAEVIEERFREIFELIKQEIDKSGYGPSSAAGIVLTGGSSMMKNLVELSEEVFNMPVRIGSPSNIKGLSDLVESPKYATAIGLVKYGIGSSLETTFLRNANPDSIFSNVSVNFKKLIKNFFDLF